MNLELLESFGQNFRNFPEEFDGALDCVSIAVTCAFNKRGTLLAVGCNDGRLVIWDFLTRGIAKVISAHVHPVCSLSWSRNGHKILTASTDNTVSVWDVMSAECDQTFRFPSPVLKVQFHPRDSMKCLVCPMKHAAILLNLDSTHVCVPLDDESDLNIVASYDRTGTYIYVGNAKGRILAIDSTTLEVKASFRISTGTSNTTAIKSIEFARRGQHFLVNSADRIVRVYDTQEVIACGKNGEPEPLQKLQDLVNRTMWKKCCFSGDGDHIVAGSSRQHSLYIWEKSWHPVRPIIASISSGLVSIWAQNQVENWSAFAPDFKELDENVEYEERESEFDIDDEDREVEETKGPQEEDIEVDVTTVEPIQAFVSSPEIEEVDEGWTEGQPIPDQEEQTDKKRSAKDQGSPAKRKKTTKNYDIDLPDAPVGEIHPSLNVKKPTEKQSRKTGGNRPKYSKSSAKDGKSKHRDRSSSWKAENGHKENLP
ncbi:hypothetical protein LSH36_66g03000 [Paralvinella palmiformis]|uniref:Uncharacterized protein n=1 Tax=Paralvinella palmiformis TaxID=53620 RepID=A0AAD9K535_9ANNE|nr:hypothetical protein LSH36_66g03000 [Paralvinella palmiformis]